MATWLITGTNRGIGLEFCKALLAKGETVIGGCRNPEGARDHWELTSDFKGLFKSVKLDVSNSSSIEACAHELRDVAIDCLINNAGVLRGDGDGFTSLKFEDIEKSMLVNTLGPMRVTRAFLAHLEQGKNPRVVHITSKMGSISDNKSGGYYAYRMSKAALNMFHASFSAEFPWITSLAMHPGWVQTEMGGERAPVTVHDSVVGMIRVIAELSKSDSGRFLDYQGHEIAW
jgi:NAD(P)-dependent dehydrogenase (short-subunit alcohol dehydrogenase family)